MAAALEKLHDDAAQPSEPDASVLPSFMSLMAQDSLGGMLKPAARHVVEHLAKRSRNRRMLSSRYQSLVLHVEKHFDEYYLLLDVLLQSRFLGKHSALFHENFYNLKRVDRGTGKALRSSHRLLSILIACGGRYVFDKAELFHDHCLRAQPQFREPLLTKTCVEFVRRYPQLKSVFQASRFLLQMMYLLNVSSIHTPLMWLVGVKLAQLTAEDQHRVNVASGTACLATNRTFMQWLLFLVRRFWSRLTGALGYAVWLGVYALQFFDWWNKHEDLSKLRIVEPDLPPPAQHPLHGPHAEQIRGRLNGLKSGQCPLCRKTRRNDTILSISGYVFCYRCILKHVRAHNTCPVTNLPASEANLIRLYAEIVKKQPAEAEVQSTSRPSEGDT